jgi:hypothetical protein
MRAIKIQTKAGRKMSETGIIPTFFHIGNFWTMDHKPLFERISIDADGLDNLPDGTILRVDRDVRYPNSLYFRKEPSNTGEPWAKLDREGETHHYINNEQPRVSSQWSGFEHASELMIIYVPES